jgi:hypothetical protein
MRFLANENVPGPVVRKLRELLHDVLWAKKTSGEKPTMRFSRGLRRSNALRSPAIRTSAS